MNDNSRPHKSLWASGLVLLGMGILSSGGVNAQENGPPSLEGPVALGELLPDSPPGGDPVKPVGSPLHEAFLGPGEIPGRVRAPKSPPPPIVERPTEDRPGDQAQWVAGYWTWDKARGDFAWVTGAWRVAPADRIWVNGRWQRDAEGWSRVPGFWSPRRGSAEEPNPTRAEPAGPAVDWRTTGPPVQQPADEPGPAPDPNAFYVPGHYAPDGDRVVWKPGFWTPMQPGWDWLPARWVRRPAGWDYREGIWVRDTNTTGLPLRHDVARPPAGTDPSALPPAIVESQPGRSDAAVDLPPSTTPTDPIAGAEDAARTSDTQASRTPPVVIVPQGVPPYGYPSPYAYPGPYGYYRPTSPRAYVPFGLMPPFARRILNRVLP